MSGRARVIQRLQCIEYHIGGQPVRVIVNGVPAPQGRTQRDKARWFERHADRFARAVVLAPRGHDDMSAVLLTEPSSSDAHAGLVFADAGGYPHLLSHGVMAAAAAAVERDLISTRDPEGRLLFDTPAGRVTASGANGSGAVVIGSVPSFVHTPGHPVMVSGRPVLVDIAFGGEFYAIVDGEAAGVPVDLAHLPELRRLGRAICGAVNTAATVVHPLDASMAGVAGAIFTGPSRHEDAHLRSAVVSAAGTLDASPSGGGTTAVMAVLDAMGLLADGQAFVHESMNGSLLTGRLAGRASAGESAALLVEIEGRAWATGEQTWLLDHDDPFRDGVRTSS